MSRARRTFGHEVVSTDLIQRDYGIGGIDFLRESTARAKHIVTNPPYGRGLGDAFAIHALNLTRETGGTVAMLLNLASLCHPKRHAFWINHPPSVIYGLDELVCWPEGDPSQARSSTVQQRYCWVVWKPNCPVGTSFFWLRVGDFKTVKVDSRSARCAYTSHVANCLLGVC
jgi:hypothetical protein